MGTPFQHRMTDMYTLSWASQVAQWVKDPPAVQETEEMQADACRIDPRVRKIPWRRKWQPTPLFLPGESHGQRNLEGYSPWSCKESDTTEQLSTHSTHSFVFYQRQSQSFIYYSHLVKSQGNALWTMSNHCKVFKAHFWK